ncbi:MAG: response regulator transcription factor [Acidimicrobiia bacterium]|nr:response regulator transcription factor [Acidimicrobiia bacterium]
MTIRVVVADDHPIVRQGLVALLANEPDIEVVADVADGRAAVSAVLAEEPDVVLMDLRMPEMDGVEATRAVRARRPGVAVLVVTTYDTDEAIVRAVEAGAAGYMLKDSPTDALVDAVRRAAAGETVLAPPITKRLNDRDRRVSPYALTSREIELLRAVAGGNTNAEIAASPFISEATVKTHLIHIFEKLAVSDRAAAVARAYERGFLSI